MELNLRQAVINNVKNSDAKQLGEIIQESVGGEDAVLPGMGVLFELIWTNAAPEIRQQLLQILHTSLQSPANVN
ncbi:small acid-soluble spore protein SspI [Paenibacillus albiflavus]|uniref:Small, acid-soluble spore protein I n=1 Tax=Paenibacillus albiflavus TaxID=2545760 RepID=A0A4R4ECK7_9BACL|nr:small acid-soluble spore protein SspI [Paenibacillus albiflavus]TCZ75891.1 small acid-soluble spore protein SspI [Paenibacillus albiflavus]